MTKRDGRARVTMMADIKGVADIALVWGLALYPLRAQVCQVDAGRCR